MARNQPDLGHHRRDPATSGEIRARPGPDPARSGPDPATSGEIRARSGETRARSGDGPDPATSIAGLQRSSGHLVAG
jgi:hypothetical protein